MQQTPVTAILSRPTCWQCVLQRSNGFPAKVGSGLKAVKPTRGRLCVEDTVVGGQRIPAGAKLWLNVMAIHHDPAHYPEPGVTPRSQSAQ